MKFRDVKFGEMFKHKYEDKKHILHWNILLKIHENGMGIGVADEAGNEINAVDEEGYCYFLKDNEEVEKI